MKLEIVIPTYNRAVMLRDALTSFVNADRPKEMTFRITVVDNNSNDNTRQVVEDFQKEKEIDLRYLFEKKQGRSCAVNAGIRNAEADIIGFIDDDEEISKDWFAEVEKVFGERWDEIDFISGRYLPRWEKEPPSWLPEGYEGIVGILDCGEEEKVFGEEFDGVMVGGNSVIKLNVLREVGLYNESLGRTDKGLLCCEDEEITYRLLNAGKRGIYYPRLVIHHFIAANRMTKKYHRSWCYGWGKSNAMMSKICPMPSIPTLFGVQRYLYKDAIKGFLKMIFDYLRLDFRGAFGNELKCWTLAGNIVASSTDFSLCRQFHRLKSVLLR
jgi:glycosyltransferase involved in cell wall biosynthesis